MLIKRTLNSPLLCENYLPWLNKLALAEIVDFISIHTYPVWEYKNIHEALDYTRKYFGS
jgi:exo-beta-1,3-glucanase (GH17 family)